MIRVVSFWEQGWNTPIKEYDLWHFPARELGVDDLIMIPVSGILAPNITEVNNFEDISRDNTTFVFVDESADSDLESFVHPENATYIIGRTSFSPMVSYKQEGDKVVSIKSILNSGLFWGHQAMCIVLYDRLKKQNLV
jgi:hypothetical protein